MAAFDLERLRRRHPRIVEVIPVDSRTGRGIQQLKDVLGTSSPISHNLPLL